MSFFYDVYEAFLNLRKAKLKAEENSGILSTSQQRADRRKLTGGGFRPNGIAERLRE